MILIGMRGPYTREAHELLQSYQRGLYDVAGHETWSTDVFFVLAMSHRVAQK